MSAIDEFLDFEAERKEKQAEYTAEGHMDAIRGGAVGGAIEGGIGGGFTAGPIGVPAGAVIGGLRGAGAGAIHGSQFAERNPITGKVILPAIVSTPGTIGAAINKVRGEAEREKEKGKTAAFDPALMAAAPGAGTQFAQQGFRSAFGNTLKGMVGLAGAGLIVGAGMKGLEKAYEHAANSVTRARGYKAMLEASPELKKMDRKAVERSYRTLHKFNPEMASDPMVSSSFVRSTAEMGHVPFATAGALTQARDRAKGRGVFEYGLATAQPGIALADRVTDADLRRGMAVETHKSRLRGAETASRRPEDLKQQKELETFRAGLQDKPQTPAQAEQMAYAQQMGRQTAEDQFPMANSMAEQRSYAQTAGRLMAEEDLRPKKRIRGPNG